MAFLRRSTDVQRRMETYREQVYEHIDRHIGRIYPNVAVGYLDNSLSVFGSIAHLLVVQGDPNANREAQLISMSRTEKGIGVPRDKRKYLIESRAVILGTEKPNELRKDLLDLKKLYRMDGILYMTVLETGELDDLKYFNHTERVTEPPKTPDAVLAE